MFLDRFIFYGVVAILIAAPLSFGAVHVWAYTLIIYITAALTLAWAWQTAFSKNDVKAAQWIKTPMTPYIVGLLVLVIFQAVPLPSVLFEWGGEGVYELKSQAGKLLSETGSKPFWMHAAHSRHPLFRELTKMAAIAAFFFLTLHAARSKQRINTLVVVLILIGVFEALYAIYQAFSHAPKIWWWENRVAIGAGFASGTFIGSNHFAFYMEMMFSLCVGFMFAHKKRLRRLLPGSGGIRSTLHRVVGWFAPESPNPKMLILLAGAMSMGLALLLSASRGGILSMGAAMLIVSILFFSKKNSWGHGVAALAVFGFSILWALHVGADPTLEKFDRTKDLSLRLRTSATILPMIADYPLTGVGLGNFKYVYPQYAPLDEREIYLGYRAAGYSHNDWLEAWAELGIPGGILLTMILGTYLMRMTKVWRRRRDPQAVGVGAGALAAVLAATFHSFFDFSMHVPANPFTLAAVMAIGFAAVHRQGPSYKESFFYGVRELPRYTWRSKALLIAVCVAAGGILFQSGRHFMAEIHCPTEWNSTLNLNWNPYLTDIEKAAAINPLNAEYQKKLGVYYAYIGVDDEILLRIFNERAVGHFKKALSLNPARGDCWFELGHQYARREYDMPKLMIHWFPLADRCMDMAAEWSAHDVELTARIANYWIWRSATLPEKVDISQNSAPAVVATRQEGVRRFQSQLRDLLTIAPNRWEWAAGRVWTYHPDDAVLLGIAPEGNADLSRRLLEWATDRRMDDVSS